jgi:hypothetical protein
MALNLRGSRAEGRAVREDYEVYEDPNILDIPSFGDEDEYVYRWLRVELDGKTDKKNIFFRKQQGWEFVQEDQLPEEYKAAYVKYPLKGESELLDGVVRNGDLILGKWSRRKARGYQKFVQDKNDQMNAAMMKKTLRSEDEDSGQTVSLDNESSSRVVRGRTPNFDKA